MASEFLQKQRGEFSSFFKKLELGLRPLSQAFLDLAEKTVATYPQLKGVVETMNLGKLFRGKETYPLEANVQASLNTLKAAQARRHAENQQLHLWLLAASAGGLAVVALYGYLQESGILNSADVSALDNQPNPTEAVPAGAVETLAATATQMPPTEIFIPATATLTPEPPASPTATERPFLKPEWFTPPDLNSVKRIEVDGQPVRFGVLDPDNPDEFPFPPERNISRFVQNMRDNGVKMIYLSAVVVPGENGEVFSRDSQGLMFINLAVPIFDDQGQLTGWKMARAPVAGLCPRTPLTIKDADINTPTIDIYRNMPTRLTREIEALVGSQVIASVIEPDSPLGCPESFAYQATISNDWLKDKQTPEGKIGLVTDMYTE